MYELIQKLIDWVAGKAVEGSPPIRKNGYLLSECRNRLFDFHHTTDCVIENVELRLAATGHLLFWGYRHVEGDWGFGLGNTELVYEFKLVAEWYDKREPWASNPYDLVSAHELPF